MSINRLTQQFLCTTSLRAQLVMQAPDVGRFAQPSKRKKSNTYLTLEPRMMFDGAMAATADTLEHEIITDGTGRFTFLEPSRLFEALSSPEAVEPMADPLDVLFAVQPRDIVFIDSAVADAGVIAAGVPTGTEIIYLQAGSDGLDQIAAALSTRTNISAIHIVSHGEEAQLILGNTTIDATALQSRADDLAVIRAALSENGDILLYGCDVGDGSAGAAFLQSIADATGADVAASIDVTGAASLGGDWDLEAQVGDIGAHAIVALDYQHALWATSADAAGWFGDSPANTPNASGVGHGLISAGPMTAGAGIVLSNVTLAGTTTSFQIAGATGGTLAQAITANDYITSDILTGAEALRISSIRFNQRSENPTAALMGVAVIDLTTNVLTTIASGIVIDGTTNGVTVTPTSLPALEENHTYRLAFVFYGSTANMFIDNPVITTQINEPPVANNDTLTVPVGIVRSIDVLMNDTDADADSLFVTQINGSTITVGTAVTLASGTTLTLQADGTINVNKATATLESFTYSVTDLQGHTVTATASLVGGKVASDLDSDGITDYTDIDDDNDGILDTTEGLNALGTSGTWVISGNSATSNLGNGVIARITKVSPNAFSAETFNSAGAGFWSSALENTASLAAVANWGDTYTVSFEDSLGNPVVVTNPILHLDRIGGADGTIANSGKYTLQGGLTWTELAGTDDFRTSTTTVYDSSAGLANDPSYTSQSSQAANTGTAAGSLMINGSVSSFTINTTQLGPNGSGQDGIEFKVQAAAPALDTDGDGIANYQDIDSDNDGITDNIEAQKTVGYIAPSGIGTGTTDANNDGLDDVYDAGALGAAGGIGLTPVNTDSVDTPDYIDLNSDNDALTDNQENGLGVAQPAANAADTDGDGLKDVYETAIDGNANDGFVVNEGKTPLPAATTGYLPDSDGDAAGNVPMLKDLNFRDASNLGAVNDTATIGINGVGSGSVAGNDIGAGTYTVTTQPTHGTVLMLADGKYLYSPTAGYAGADSLTYTLTDSLGGTATAVLNITVVDPNDPPMINLNDGSTSVLSYAAAWTHGSGTTAPVALSAFTTSASNETAGPGLTHVVSGTGAFVSNVAATSYLQAISNDEYLAYQFTTGAVVDPGVYISGYARNNNGYSGTVAFQLATQADFSDAVTLSQGDALGTSGYVFFNQHTALDPNTTYFVRVYFYNTVGTQRWDDFGVLLNKANPNFATTFTEGGAPVNVANVTLADVNDITEADITKITITAGNVLDGGSELITIGGKTFFSSFNSTQTAIVGGTTVKIAYEAASKTFTITNNAGAIVPMAQADLDILVRGITYNNTSDNPTIGNRTLTFTVYDSINQISTPAVATISIVPTNDAPVDGDEANIVNEDNTLTVLAASGLLVNSVDPDGAAATITGYTIAGVAGIQPVGAPVLIAGVGTITINANGSYSFAPVLNFAGVIPNITYTVSDGLLSDTSTLTLLMKSANDAPIAVDNSATTLEDTVITGNAILNNSGLGVDRDPEGQTLTLLSFKIGGTSYLAGQTATLVGVGSIKMDSSGAWTFTPATNYSGAVPTVTYTIADTGQNNAAVNGAFEGVAAGIDRTNIPNEITPPGWTLIGTDFVNGFTVTPDTYNATTNFHSQTWTASPDGGDFVHCLADPDWVEGISQTLTDLVVGQQYTVTFSQSASYFDLGGSTGNQGNWQVSVAGQTFASATLSVPANGTALPWQAQSITFTATSTTETLDFLAKLTSGSRIDLGIDGVAVNAVTPTLLTASADLKLAVTPVNDAPTVAISIVNPGDIVVIDQSVPGAQELVDALPLGTNIILIPSGVDGFANLAAQLASYTNPVNAIHILSHGESGILHLGSASMTAANASTTYAASLAIIGSHLTSTGDILVYGCNFAQDLAAVDALAAATSADIAASTDNTGSVLLGGDWVLEATAGDVQASTLAPLTFSALLAGPGGANLTPAIVTPSYSTVEDAPRVLTGISFSDPDASTGNVTVTLSVVNGTLDINTAVLGGITSAQVAGDLTGTVTITASIAAINATLANATGLTYTPTANFSGIDTITSTINDNGNTGTGGPLTATARANITVLLDTDSDGVANVNDIDDDNDGILDTVENGGALVGNANSGSGAFKDTLYWLNWGATFNDGVQVGDTQSFTLADGSIITVKVTAASAEMANARPSDMATWFFSQLDDLYNTPGTSEALYSAFTNQPRTLTMSIIGVDVNGKPFNPDIIFSDSETTNDTETMSMTTNGSPWRSIESVGTGGVYTGSASQTVTFTDTSSGLTLFRSDGATTMSWTAPPKAAGVNGLQAFALAIVRPTDTDGDGIQNSLDIDSDNDGITDNVEAQTTAGYIAPSGIGAAMVDVNNDGLDDNYGTAGLTPVNTDAGATTTDATPDYLDSDSDNDGKADITERGDGQPISITSTTDSDQDGLLDIFEAGSVNDGFDVNDSNRTATTLNLAAAFTVNATGTNAVPITNDLLFRYVLQPPTIDADFNNSSGKTGSDYLTTFIENGAPVAVVDTDVVITNSASPILQSATVVFTGLLAGDSTNVGPMPSGLAALADTSVPGQTTYTIVGSASLADYQLALRAITFSVAGENPSAAPRYATISVNDGNADSNPANITLNVLPVNDPPVIDLDGNNSTASGANYVTSYTENGAPIKILDTDASLADLDNTNMQSADVVLTNAQAGDVFAVGTLPPGITATITGTGPGTITIRFSGSDTVTNYFAAINAVQFSNSSDNPNTTQRVITVQITDGTDLSNLATAKINVIAVNDPPVVDLNGAGAGTGFVAAYTENGAGVSIAAPTLTVTDPDNTTLQSATIILTDPVVGDLLAAGLMPAGITASAYDPVTHKITLTGAATLADYQAAIAAITFASTSDNPTAAPRHINVTVNDGALNSNTAVSTINVTPVNDPPVLDLNGSSAGTGFVTAYTENGAGISIADPTVSVNDPDNTTLQSATILLTDPVLGDVLAAGVMPAGISASAYDPVTHTITLTGSGTLADYQAAIAAITFASTSDNPTSAPRHINVTVNDGELNSNTAVTTINVTPVNDPPVLTAPIADVNTTDGGPVSVDAATHFSDPDTDTLSYSLAAGSPSWLTINPTTGVVSGIPPANASQILGGIYPISVIATDPDGLTATANFKVNVINLPPVANPDVASVSEDGPLVAGNIITDVGTGKDIEPAPDSDTLTILSATQGANVITVGTPFTSAGGGVLTLLPGGGYTFDPGTAYNGLKAGQIATEVINYVVTDGNGGTSPSTFIITVNGLNDAPVPVDPGNPGPDPHNPIPADPNSIVPVQKITDGQTFPLATPLISLAPYFVDPDGNPVTFTTSSPLPNGLTLNPDGTITGTVDPSASQGGDPAHPGQYTITVLASDGIASTPITVVIDVSNPPPAAVADTGVIGEDAHLTLMGNVLIGPGADHDSLPDSDPLYVAAVNGAPTFVGQPVQGSTGGTFVINKDGTWSFDPGSDFQALNAGETRSTTITYRVADGQGGTAETTVTVTVTGAPDAPVALGPIAPVNGVDGQPVTPIDVGSKFVNPTALPLTYTATGLPPGLSLDPVTGIITGTFPNDASVGGPYIVNVTATAPDGSTASIPVEIKVTNPAPTAVNDSAQTPVNTPVIIAPLANDTDPDKDPISIASVGTPAHGTVVINPDGTVKYTPTPGYTGPDSFTYVVTDNQGGTSTATVTVNVGAPDAGTPTATPMVPATGVDGVPIAPINVTPNFTDPNGDPLTFTATGLPPGLSLDPATGVVTGTLPNDASTHGPYTVNVTATDPSGNQVTMPMVIVITNPAPAAVNDEATTPINTAVKLNVLGNDTDPDKDPLLVSAVTQPAHGTVVINPDGTVTYTPNAGYTGPDTFTYTASDGQGGLSIATVTLGVGSTNPNAPTAGPMPGQPGTDVSPVSIDVKTLASVTDPNNDPLIYTAIGLPSGLTINPTTGVITGTLPNDASAKGPYTIEVYGTDPSGASVGIPFVLTVVNPAPTAATDKASTPVDQPVNIAVLANDVDPDKDVLTITGTTPPTHGTVSINPDGTLKYTPTSGYIGPDSFTYTITDAQGKTSQATVEVTVGPAVTLTAPPAIEPILATDGETIVPVPIGTIFGDPDLTSPLTITIDPTNLPFGIIYNPVTKQFEGTAGPSDSQGSTPGQPPGTYIVPVVGMDGSGLSTTAYVTFKFINLPPVAAPDSAIVPEDGPMISGNVIDGGAGGVGADLDTAPDTDPLSVISATQGANPITFGTAFTTAGGGVLTLLAGGGYTFNPGTAYNGLGLGETATEVINYIVSDGNGGTSPTTLTITINGANDKPVIVDPTDPGPDPTNPKPADPNTIVPKQTVSDGQVFTAGTPLVNLAPYAVDPDGDVMTFTTSSPLPIGLTLNPDGTITGTVDKSASQNGDALHPGQYTLTVLVSDGKATTTVTVVITVANLPPVAVNDHSIGDEDHPQTGNVITDPLTGDYDTAPDSDPLTVTNVAGAAPGSLIALTYGTLTMSSTGAWTFTPNALANALPAGALVHETISYSIADGNGGTANATLTIDIKGVNDAPLGTVLPPKTALEGSPITIPVQSHFSDLDTPDVLKYSAAGLPPGLLIDPNTGLITGTLAPGVAAGGPYTINVTANDQHGGTVTVPFILTVEVPTGPTNAPLPNPLPLSGIGFHPAPSIDHVIDETVRKIGPMRDAPDLQDLVITRTVQSLADTHAVTNIDAGNDPVHQVVEWLGKQGRSSSWIEGLFDTLEHTPYIGDTAGLALSAQGNDQFTVRTLIHDGALFIGIDETVPGARVVNIVEQGYKGLPDFATRMGDQDVIINRPPTGGWIDLDVTGQLADGRRAHWSISVNMDTSEVVSIAKVQKHAMILPERGKTVQAAALLNTHDSTRARSG
jgi:VCBS repeat-containing protein